ncbi:MAG: hypothetical protein VKL59_19415 [Nostocaceae cyanobacterium]|nr:hypothetical protein [Nostocaceae cyanobacterium]
MTVRNISRNWASGIGHRASGIGHRASGIGHRASGIGHGDWVMGISYAYYLFPN